MEKADEAEGEAVRAAQRLLVAGQVFCLASGMLFEQCDLGRALWLQGSMFLFGFNVACGLARWWPRLPGERS